MANASTSAGPQPNTALYLKNLNTKTKKTELRRQLYALFSTYGHVIDVVSTRAEGMRGQAFVVFEDLSSATAARRALDGFDFYDRSIRIDYANSRSKATMVLENGPEALFDPSFASGGAAEATNRVTLSSAQAERVGREKKKAREEARQRGEKVDASDDEEDEDDEEDDDDAGAATDGQASVAADGVNGRRRRTPDATAAAEEREAKARKIDGQRPDASAGGDEGDKDGDQDEDEDEDEDDEAAMDMASDEEDTDTPGPAAPPS